MIITNEDLHNLEVIFTLARQATVSDEKQLVGVINFKALLFEKLNKLLIEETLPLAPVDKKEDNL